MRQWLNSLTELDMAGYLATLQPGVAGVEHYRRVVGELRLTVEGNESRISTTHSVNEKDWDTWPVVSQQWNNRRRQVKYLGGAPIRMNCAMLKNVLRFDASQLIDAADDSAEYEVAGTVCLLNELPAALVTAMRAAHWFHYPLVKWHKVFKTIMEGMRRTGTFGSVNSDSVFAARGMFKVTIRTDDEADWAQEKTDRRNMAFVKHSPLADDKNTSRESYYDKFQTYLYKMCAHVVDSVGTSRQLESLDEWWAARHHATPAGASSLRKFANAALSADARFEGSDRANKKAVVELLDDGYPGSVLRSAPFNWARCSTKPEPGMKQRALYASEDGHYTVAAYASVHMEKEMHGYGMVAKQRPEDVGEWYAVHTAAQDGYWLSADFSNFNAQHLHAELILLNTTLSDCWLRREVNEATVMKAVCANWLAHAFTYSVATFPDGTIQPVTNGLYSGSRDTARDNTMLHAVISHVSYDLARELDGDFVEPWKAFCGDDEDSKFACIYDALLYINLLASQNNDLNALKQLAGKRTHEFLRCLAFDDSLPERPMASLLSTLASGNWYTERALWYDSVIQSCSSNWWDMVCRGMRLAHAQRLCAMYLNTLMRYKCDKTDNWVELEWYEFRDPDGESPLWHATPGASRRPPKISTELHHKAGLPNNASKAWCSRVRKLLAMVPFNRLEDYENYLFRESYIGSYSKYRQRTQAEQVAQLWPRRTTKRINFGRHTQPYTLKLQVWREVVASFERSEQPATEEEQIARIGLDVALVNLIGKHRLYEMPLDPRYWQRWQPVTESKQLLWPAHFAPPAFRYLAAKTKLFSPEVHVTPRLWHPEKRLTYVLGAAGSGKSWVSKHLTTAMDMDVAVYQTTGWPERCAVSKLDWTRAAEVACERAVAYAWAHGCTLLFGQWPWVLVDQVATRNYYVMQHILLDVPLDVRSRRLEERGYSLEKISLYECYWQEAKANHKGTVYGDSAALLNQLL